VKKFLGNNFQIFFNLASMIAALATVWSLFFKPVPDIRFALVLVIFNVALLGVSGALNRLVDALPKEN
jgi:branched-subunit amino acid ABC-type transport system permease component